MLGKLKNAGKDIFKINQHNLKDFTEYCDKFDQLIVESKELYCANYDAESFESCLSLL